MPAETHNHNRPPTADEIAAVVTGCFADVLGINIEDVSLTDTLVGDLAADELMVFDIVSMIEDELGERTVGIGFDDEDVREFETIGDVVDYAQVKVD